MNDVEHFENGWHKQRTKHHICIWSDEWLEKVESQITEKDKIDE
jgi:hypothetical protein